MKSLVFYESTGGNTEKVAQRISRTLDSIPGNETDLIKLSPEIEIDFFQYDLVFLGSPVVAALPTQSMMDCIKRHHKLYVKQDKIVPSSPLLPGKYGICFCTYAGPHIGMGEALPATMLMRSFLEHIGYSVLDQWHTLGEFHNRHDLSTQGRMGNILGRPNENDLLDIENRVKGVLNSLGETINKV
ncbi:MAG: flavodoxin domain-containing protein [Spirochaetales bacterium]|nr:flavodoxin domain-containing protein [Spirochaetales bacterium]